MTVKHSTGPANNRQTDNDPSNGPLSVSYDTGAQHRHAPEHKRVNTTMYTNEGVVFKKSTGIYTVHTADGQIVTCTISSRLRKQLIYPMRDPSSLGYFKVVDVKDIHEVDPVAVGDKVTFTDADDGTGMISEVQVRRSKLTRRAPGPKPLEQVVVANADQIVAVFAAAQPAPTWHMLDRYLAGAEASDIPAVICIAKMDLVRGKKAEHKILEVVDEYREIGYTVLLTSTASGEGIDSARDLLAGKISALVGKSGVGKTTLLNAIQPELGLRVGEVNENLDKGRHTTTYLEMFPLDVGGAVVDTPGMKTFGLWDVDESDIPLLFREFVAHVGGCKFGASCTHEHEPGCAVKRAVADGHISQRRYDSYLVLREHIYAEEK